MKINLFNHIVELKSDMSSYPGSIHELDFIKRTYKIDIIKDNESIDVNLILDERDNTIQIVFGGKKTPNLIKEDNVAIANYIVKKFYELKSSDINYGNHEYDGNKALSIQDFFSYLKSENRNNLLNTIINAS